MVTPVVSLPQDSVIVFVSKAGDMDSRTGETALIPIPAEAPAHTLIL